MSFVIEYKPMFIVMVQDSAGKTLPGFSFTPTESTRKRMADHHLLFRRREYGFDVYYQSNPLVAAPLLGPIRSRMQFVFYFNLSEGDFFSRYKPKLTPETGAQFYLDNLTSSGNIQLKSTLSNWISVQTSDAAQLFSPVFTALVPFSGGAPTKFVLRDKFDPTKVICDVPAQVAGGQATAKIDLSKSPPGPYTLETDVGGAKKQTIYVDTELASADSHGLVALSWETPQDSISANGQTYQVKFEKL